MQTGVGGALIVPQGWHRHKDCVFRERDRSAQPEQGPGSGQMALRHHHAVGPTLGKDTPSFMHQISIRLQVLC